LALLRTPHSTSGNFARFILTISTALFFSGFAWVLYIALEPYVRRHWPQAIIS
jgi:hypothetical protein